MRLNNWTRWGVALSIIWALGAAVYQRGVDIDRAEDFANFAHKVCSQRAAIHDNDLKRCDQERTVILASWMLGSWNNVALIALVPIPFGWLAGFILLHFGRAQAIGLRAVVSWSTLNWPKKAFVAFSALATLATVLFGVTVIMNLYVDSLVPVALGSSAMVIKVGDEFVAANGTWTRSGSTEGSRMGYPLQTSHIECRRDGNRCTEARASVSHNVLASELVEYEIESWSDTTIVFKNEAPCAIEVFTIDLKTESVNGAGHRTDNDAKFCKVYPVEEEHWSYRLSDGFPVYWEQRQRVRPLLLRLIQTMFGN